MSKTQNEIAPPVLCFSHLRWDFVYQRPQHLLSRCARERRVFFIEEPIITEDREHLNISDRTGGVSVIQPHLHSSDGNHSATESAVKRLLDGFLLNQDLRDYVSWYYTPMAMGFTRHLKPLVTVYDCMDELSAFKNAPPLLKEREQELFKQADLVFTGGHSLYEAKRAQHHSVYAFPSSIDRAHFAQARSISGDPDDQREIQRARLGYCGVIDERMDLGLLDEIARARPEWQLVMIGPVVKIDPGALPRRANIHFLGGKDYQDLPAYLAGWDVALLPFAINESTRFISPTKTPEYLAAGKPVVSTSIRDVVRPYGELGIVRIADTAADFIAEAEAAMSEDPAERLRAADDLLGQTSWDATWERMRELIDNVLFARLLAIESTAVPLVARAAAIGA